MIVTNALWLNFAVALGIGLIIGADRERNKSAHENNAIAGIRTFAIAALLGATSFMVSIWLHIATLMAVVIFVSVTNFANKDKLPGLTTAVSLLLTVILGGLTMTNAALAASLAVATALLLLIKKPLHGFVLQSVTQSELYEFLMLAAATLIILPIVPNAFIGPFDAINPRNLWLIVIFIMAINVLGHLALRILGQRIGLAVVGFFSGFISSLATVGSMGERTKQNPSLVYSAACGATFSSAATIIQLAILLAAIDVATLNVLKIPLICAITSIALYGSLLTFQSLHQNTQHIVNKESAFSIKTALWFAAMIGIVLIASAALQVWFGQKGLIIGAGVAGLADAHSPSISVATMVVSGKISAANAVIPILVAVSVNTLSKGVMAIASGNKTFAAQVILGLMIQVSAMWAGWWLF
jgi:uncharacterized membrane protein (DUF4010 family)